MTEAQRQFVIQILKVLKQLERLLQDLIKK
jgi:hypothetical protein